MAHLSRTLPILLLMVFATSAHSQPASFDVELRSRIADDEGWVRPVVAQQHWDARQTAVIVCDMWDAHHCLNAVRRVKEMAPRMNELLKAARRSGATIIHAPSSCMAFYNDHPARERARAVPKSGSLPTQIESWCNWKDNTEERIGYPIDHSDGGEDDDAQEHQQWHDQLQAMGRKPGAPWVRQIATLEIEDVDYITDDGVENWNILENLGIKNVMLLGVHTNMCVLGRPFGLRQLAKNGKNVVLVRDMTDTMYNPAMPPYVSHFSGTDLIVEHIEQYVCPTITSDQILGGTPFRFRHDRRPHIVMLIGEQEYNTKVTLPAFARQFLYKDFRLSYVFADPEDGNNFPGIEAVADADLLLVSVRRRTPPTEQLQVIRDFIDQGKPVVGIRTASHAFSLRGDQAPAGHGAWPEFDAEILGGNYQGHHGNKQGEDLRTYVWTKDGAESNPIMSGLPTGERLTTSWLYKTSPLKPGASVLMMGRVGDRKPHEPVTWTYVHRGGGRAFYTSLGHPDDFSDVDFQRMLVRGIYWAVAQPVPDTKLASVR